VLFHSSTKPFTWVRGQPVQGAMCTVHAAEAPVHLHGDHEHQLRQMRWLRRAFTIIADRQFRCIAHASSHGNLRLLDYTTMRVHPSMGARVAPCTPSRPAPSSSLSARLFLCTSSPPCLSRTLPRLSIPIVFPLAFAVGSSNIYLSCHFEPHTRPLKCPQLPNT
jgi:hypothetical protein